MRTVGVAPGTFTIQLDGACPPDSPGMYTFSPFTTGGDSGVGPIVAQDAVTVFSPYATDSKLNGLGDYTPPTALGIRLDILGAVLGTIVVAGLVLGSLAGLTKKH